MPHSARLAAPYKARVALALGFLLIATFAALAPPYLAKLAIDDGIAKGDLTALGWIVGAFVAVGLVYLGASAAQTYFTGWTGERVLADLRNGLFRHLQHLSLGYYERNRAGVIISRLTNDIDALDQLVTEGVTSLLKNTLLLLGSIVILFFLDWRLALATLLVMPALIVATAMFRWRSTLAYRAVRERLGLVTATLAEDIAGMRVLQSFTREEPALTNFYEVNDNYRQANRRTVILSGVYFPTVDFLSSVATAIVLGYGGYLVSGGDITVGTLFAFIGYLTNFFDPVQDLSQFYNTYLSATAALDKIMDSPRGRAGRRRCAGSTPALPHRRGCSLRAGPVWYGDGPEVIHGSASTCRRGRRSPSSARPAPASRRSRSCSRVSTTPRRAESRSTARTSARSRRIRSARSSASCRRTSSSLSGPSARTSPTVGRTRRQRT